MPRSRRFPVLAPLLAPALLLPAAACGRDAPAEAPDAPRIYTVAGVVQVTNPVVPPAGRLELLAAFGGLGPAGEAQPSDFGRINAVTADAEGLVYVAEGQAREIRVFDAEGRTCGRSDARGRGPASSARCTRWGGWATRWWRSTPATPASSA